MLIKSGILEFKLWDGGGYRLHGLVTSKRCR